MTADTESSALVGAYSPAEEEERTQENSPPVVWRDGVVTEAVKSGLWVVLDNISDAEA